MNLEEREARQAKARAPFGYSIDAVIIALI